MEEAPDGVLAVFHAIAEQDPDVLIHQFGNGTSPGLCNAFGVSAAGYAAAIGKLSPALLRFLGPNVKDINSGSPAPLIFAAFGGHAHVVRFLLMHGADPNLPCPRSGVTPLMVAALLGHEAVVDLLLEWGADTNVLSSRGDTALSLAAGSPFLSSPPIIKKLHPLTSRRPKRCETGSESSGDSMVETVTKGKSWEFLGGSGMKHEDSPLLHASMNGNLEAVALLISKGASLDDPEPQFGWTPLMQALFHRKWEVAKYLIEAGADVAYKTKDGMTAFDVALLVDIGLNDQELFQLLCQRVAASTTSSLKLTSSPSASAIALNKENLESTSFWRKLFIMPWKSQNRERKESDVKQKRQNGVLSISHENLGLSKCSLSEDSAAGKGDRRASLPEMVVNAQNCSKEVSWMALLKKYGLQDAERLLKEHEVDEYAFLVLTREDFLEIGIPQAQVSALLQVQQQLLHKEKTKGWRWFGASLSSAAAGMISSSAGKKPQEESDWQQVKLQADELYDSHNFHTLYTLLLPYKDSDIDELLWRLARAAYEESKLVDEKQREKELILEAASYVRRALEVNAENAAAHKWMAILLDKTSRYEGTKATILNAYKIREHMQASLSNLHSVSFPLSQMFHYWISFPHPQRSHELNPKDATTLYLMGSWCFAIAEMPWYQRRLASAIFATPPESSFEEALEFFLKAENLDPHFYNQNLLMIGKTLKKLGRNNDAVKYLQDAAGYPVQSVEDRKVSEEASALLAST